ncbi:hypothetical protein K505DRAFT_413483 [Melanomma pulvis-pyrius CBS 109.77]|uniref:Transcription factor domain-containing protein n=1 Tax=Melanomma pulvis-pyrius CBS 109.77 TaxID=1314802 RepID=A0A6A6XT26_9PLEO|nr:hypothetical protein K505DRAFT_413483 [Melanomma pulvis-pyrius CBS 109.77]
MPAQFEFVPAGDFGKPKSADRRLIRSHCMQGKNKRGGSRRSKQQDRRAAKVPPQTLQTLPNPPIPVPPPSDIALVQLPGELGLHSEEILFKYLSYGAVRNLVSPIEVCVNVDPLQPNYFAWPFYDVTFFHAAMLTTSATNDFMLKRPMTKTTYFHLRRTLHFLNQKLCEEDAFLVDSTVYVIVMLTLMAATFGDSNAAGAHMSGLQRIVKLRGGMEYLRCTPKLHYKLDRLDLSWCLGFGGKPRFVDPNISWDPVFESQALSFENNTASNTLVDSRLLIVFQDVRSVVRSINEHFSRNTKFHGELFQESISSVQSRLLLLKDMLLNAVDECIPKRKVPYRDLRRRLRGSLQSTWVKTQKYQDLMLWVLVVCAISVLDDDPAWLAERWSGVAEADMSWEETRQRLQSVMWIDCIHDELGTEAFSTLTDQSHSVLLEEVTDDCHRNTVVT